MILRQPKEKSGRLTFMIVVAFLAALLIFAMGPGLAGIDISQAAEDNDGEDNNGPRFCSRTARAAFRACNGEATDGYWIAIGNCNNLSDDGARNDCVRDAKAAFREGGKECKDQREARLEICEELGEAPFDPQLEPANFVDPENIGGSETPNRYFPLIAGNLWIYEGETDEGTETISVTVTADTKDIEYPAGSGNLFKCAVVNDVVQLNGEVIENTDDWYAQDTEGNVWYFGEAVLNFEDGELDNLDGSWKAGKDVLAYYIMNSYEQ